ncbi:hypothetical protein RI129_008602 [Pyrocoelia pectoralis]|uniref:Uncharacterized protein n=1 Tax=Pyrocoelia pectoralis TaxID=417401 RepID=A0AAN7V5R4_9COLE
MNFASEKKTRQIKVGHKVHEIRVQRDLFGRLLPLAMEDNIDVEKTLSYPITSVPMSLCHADGTLHQTPKSAMVGVLTSNSINDEVPRRFDAVIFDGFFLLHTMKDIPKTFGNISKKIMSILTATHARRVDVVFDQYFSPSIKEYERAQRHEVRNREYFITGPEQVRPVDFIKELLNLNYKECYIYSAHNNSVTYAYDNLSCQNHEEADTKIIFHICQMDNDVSDVLIKTSDTDILIVMLGNMDHLRNNNLKIYMEYGTMHSKKWINISELQITLGPLLCQSLPGFHALTGCDFNPYFLRRGEKKPYKLLEKNILYQKAFAALGTDEFVCRMYGMNCDDVNDARYHKFLATYKTSGTKVFKKTRISYDSSNLPPCQRELRQQLLRTVYITHIWRNSHLKEPTVLTPEGNGWNLIDENYTGELNNEESDDDEELITDVSDYDENK